MKQVANNSLNNKTIANFIIAILLLLLLFILFYSYCNCTYSGLANTHLSLCQCFTEPCGCRPTMPRSSLVRQNTDGAFITNNIRFHNYKCIITAPDGTTQTITSGCLTSNRLHILEHSVRLPQPKPAHTHSTFPSQDKKYTDYQSNQTSALHKQHFPRQLSQKHF